MGIQVNIPPVSGRIFNPIQQELMDSKFSFAMAWISQYFTDYFVKAFFNEIRLSLISNSAPKCLIIKIPIVEYGKVLARIKNTEVTNIQKIISERGHTLDDMRIKANNHSDYKSLLTICKKN
uniref:Uncharacterized protein n=1 Tax=Romanomermis culicivorax TaxID=13658 RepID=A0A915L907_ROMCU